MASAAIPPHLGAVVLAGLVLLAAPSACFGVEVTAALDLRVGH